MIFISLTSTAHKLSNSTGSIAKYSDSFDITSDVYL